MEWITAINTALHYIEDNLDGELDIASTAKKTGFSQFYLQRMFSMMTDMTISEYIRCRRLSMAGQELAAGNAKVIDVAFKYGYETPESFQKAFRRFHGITPSATKNSRVHLRYLNPLQLKIELTGGTIMDYCVENIGELIFIGKEKRFRYDSAFTQIPVFWDEYYKQGLGEVSPGYLGICLDEENSNEFSYFIARFCEQDEQPPEGFVKKSIPAYTWAKFRATGKIPEAIQSVNRRIYTEWLPNNQDYEIAAGMNIEMYTEGDMDSDDYVSEIWLPIKRVNGSEQN